MMKLKSPSRRRNIYLPDDLVTSIKTIAKRSRRSMSNVIRVAIEEFIKREIEASK